MRQSTSHSKYGSPKHADIPPIRGAPSVRLARRGGTRRAVSLLRACSKGRAPWVLALLAATVGVVLLAGAAHAQGWSQPTNISNSAGDSKRPAVAVDQDGSLHVVWEDQSSGNWDILYASRRPGERWSDPVNISNNPGGSFRPAITVGANGSVHVAWHDDTFGNWDILYAVKAADASWSEPTNISQTSGWSFWPSIVLGADDSVHVAWHDNTAGNWEVLSASKPLDGPWSPPSNLSGSAGVSFTPVLFSEKDGSVDAVWQDDASGNPEIFTASKAAGGAWSVPEDISNTATASAPFALTSIPNAGARVVWREETAEGARLFSVEKVPGEGWSVPEDLGGAVGGSGRFAIGEGKDGDLYLVWDDLWEGDREILVSTRTPDGTWSPTSNISRAQGDSTLPALAPGGDGSIHVVWRDDSPGNGEIFYSGTYPGPEANDGVPSAAVQLDRGCNRITSTYPDSTSVRTLASAVSPPEVLLSMWKRQEDDWLGYSASYLQVSDLFEQDSQEPLFVCVSAPAQFASLHG